MKIKGKNNLNLREFDQAIKTYPEARRALCFGDSWFQYPVQPIDLNKTLARRFKGTLFLNEGVAGRASSQWKRALPRIGRAIREYQFDAILLSNGGNDVVGSELVEYLKEADQAQAAGVWRFGRIPPEVRDHVRLDRFDRALEYAITDLEEIVQCRDQGAPNSTILVHTYDYVYPSGTPWRLGPLEQGPWIKPAFVDVGLEDESRIRVVTNWMLDQFSARLQAYASTKLRMRVIGSLGTLSKRTHWNDELHPSRSGFAKLSTSAWVPALLDLLL